jgi:hypothetical protein
VSAGRLPWISVMTASRFKLELPGRLTTFYALTNIGSIDICVYR